MFCAFLFFYFWSIVCLGRLGLFVPIVSSDLRVTWFDLDWLVNESRQIC